MAAYAIKADPKIEKILSDTGIIAIDGLRSWEEYLYLIKKYSGLTLINVYAEPSLRYERLENRKVRSFTLEEARNRDIAELENLNMGGPIAIADHLVVNNTTKEELHTQIDYLLALLT
jgi:dephospho-CoA kinase